MNQEVHTITHVIAACPICGGRMKIGSTLTNHVTQRITRYTYCVVTDCEGRGKSVEDLPARKENSNSFTEL